MTQILEILFLIVLIIQVFYYLFFFSRFAFSKNNALSKNTFPVSVIICAKNESKNLKDFLPSIINQEHSDFELILVNDHSTDDTLQVMNSFKKRHSFIRVIDIQTGTASKKKAISIGIEAAKNEHLLFTDADCRANSTQWITEMTTHFSSEKSIVLGYGAHQKIKNSWLNKLLRFETLLTAIQYFSYAKTGLPYMGVGRNIAYTKTQFKAANGFEQHQHIKSGDDDLFVNQIATKKNVSCAYQNKSFTISKPHDNFKKWFYQKRRHITTATNYKPLHQFLLGLFYFSQFTFWLLAIILFFYAANSYYVFLLFTIRIILQLVVFGFSAKKLNEKDLILFIPFLELFLIVIQLSLYITNLVSKPKTWNA